MTASASLFLPAEVSYEILDRVAVETDLNRLQRLIPLVSRACRELRLRSGSDAEWRRTIEQLRSHPAWQRLLRDPYGNRAFEKPRGYAGDADMLDHLYKPVLGRTFSESVSEDGKAILAYSSECPAARAVRNRRALLATAVDSLADGQASLRVASLACGYLREAELMSAIELGRIERYYALDQDEDCVAHVSRTFVNTPVQGQKTSVRDLLKRSADLVEVTGLHFFYAAGIFDYLREPLAAFVTAEMFGRLRPGGILWIANFVPDIPDRAYMEAFMDWWLVYRSSDELGGLDIKIPQHEVAHKRLFLESEGNVAFLELVRA